MLVCPQCQFENPDGNKFCQNCGTSLTWKTCSQCEATVALDEEKCSDCGSPMGTYWWAIVHRPTSIITEVEDTEVTSADVLSSIEAKPKTATEVSGSLEEWIMGTATIAPPVTVEMSQMEESETIERFECNLEYLLGQFSSEYLDRGKRYRIIAAESREVDRTTAGQWFHLKVLDRQPWQKSPVIILQQKYLELFERLNADPTDDSETQFCQKTGIPPVALPYLKLERLNPTIPKIYDAWLEDDLEIFLLPDRSTLRVMSELWQQKDLNYLQLAWWLDEMFKVWTGLSRSGCAQSLLEPDNLRVDEDQSLCLQQLYLDPPDTPATLANLAQMLQQWLQQSETMHHEGLNRLLIEVIDGRIQSETQLRTFMQNAALAQLFATEAENTPSPSIAKSGTNAIADRQISETAMPETSYPESTEDREFATMALPMKLLGVNETGCTDVGSQRDHNEDCFTIETEIKTQENGRGKSIRAKGLYIVCDGMGGHAAGEVASAMAVESLQSYFYTYWQDDLPDKETIEQGILLANQTLYKENLSHARSGSGRMGTTLVMALLQDNKLAVAHVGDSRVYRITRSQGLEQLTVDHEVGQRDIQRGVDPDIAYARPDAYQLTQALGPRDNNFVKPEVKYYELTEDCLLLLCSDGLSDNYLLEDHWQAYFPTLISSSANLEEGLSKLIDFANDFNGHDNITGVLVRIKLQPNLELLPMSS
jgi:protein phosphatase